MTNNDYIAEYVKEKYPNILGFDFEVWKMIKAFSNAINSVDWSKIGTALGNIAKVQAECSEELCEDDDFQADTEGI